MKLVIVRHGDPDYTIDSLTEKGWKEAKLLAKRLEKLDVDSVFCSPLGRAKDTMKPYLELTGKTAKIEDWLEEFNYCTIKNPENGEDKIIWDFKPNYLSTEPNFFNNEKWYDIDCIKSSNIKQTLDNVFLNFDKCLENFGYKRNGLFYDVVNGNHKTIIFFCHFGIEAILLSHLFNTSPQVISHNFMANPTSVTTLISEEREKGTAYFRCQQFGDISHLFSANEPPAFAGRFCECFEDDTRH